MSLRRSEGELLAAIRDRFARSSAGDLEVGVGDDAAVVRFRSLRQVVSTDLLVEGVDLPRGTHPAFFARKAMAANVSDLFASGARPSLALVALGIPVEAGDEDVDSFFDALEGASRRWACPVAGGDLSSAPVWTVAVTVFGEPVAEPWLRHGARAGDDLWWLGRPAGAAAAGLRLLLAGAEARPDGAVRFPESWELGPDEESVAAEALFAQLDPHPFGLAPVLAVAGGVSAAIDVSDGLWLDARRLADASEVALEIDRESIPVFALSESLERRLGRDPLSDALGGGEDFALLVSASPDASRVWPESVRGEARRIGRVAAGRDVRLLDRGREVAPPRKAGFDHFARPEPA